MNLSRRTLEPEPSREAVDAVIDAYVAWREASAAANAAYLNWSSALVAERGTAFMRYRFALEGEERAAARYQLVLEAISP